MDVKLFKDNKNRFKNPYSDNLSKKGKITKGPHTKIRCNNIRSNSKVISVSLLDKYNKLHLNKVVKNLINQEIYRYTNIQNCLSLGINLNCYKYNTKSILNQFSAVEGILRSLNTSDND